MFTSAIALAVVLAAQPPAMLVHDGDRHANTDPQMKSWFDHLASGRGLCCSFADGSTVDDVDWDTVNGHYRVRLHQEWVMVPDAAVITESNKVGIPVVWPYLDINGETQIRCFMPGAGG